jgi:type IV pilus assembly protein PilN
MIKINLLSEGKRAAVRKIKATQMLEGKDLAPWLLTAGLVIAVLAFGISWWILRSTVKQKEHEVAEAQKEIDELAEVIKEVEEFQAQKAELERKIKVITDLKLNQQGPVRVMDDISRALPELLWLDRMRMDPSTIEIEGRAFNTNALANFIDNLDKVEGFGEPIPKDTQEQSGGVYKFIIDFDYSLAPLTGVKVEEAAPPPAQAPATGG